MERHLGDSNELNMDRKSADSESYIKEKLLGEKKREFDVSN